IRRFPGSEIGLSPSNGSPEAWASTWRTVEPGGPAGSSRSTTPSSAATSVARAVAGFVTDAQRNPWLASPCVARTPSGPTTPAAAWSAPHSSICCRASRARDTSRVERRRIAGHAPMEPVVGYSRAVVAGRHVYVSGTAPIPADGGEPPEGAYEQARLCLEIVLAALERAGARAEDVVRTRMYAVDTDTFEEIGRAHGEVFGAIRPATAWIGVSHLADPRWRVEIEADAVVEGTAS